VLKRLQMLVLELEKRLWIKKGNLAFEASQKSW
jgi:hypothetical protein